MCFKYSPLAMSFLKTQLKLIGTLLCLFELVSFWLAHKRICSTDTFFKLILIHFNRKVRARLDFYSWLLSKKAPQNLWENENNFLQHFTVLKG